MKQIETKESPAEPAATATIKKRPARIVKFEPGSPWLHESEAVTIMRQVAVDRVIVQFGQDDRVETVSAAVLTPSISADDAPDMSSRQKSLHEHSQATWEKAETENAQIAALVESNDISPKARARVATALNIGDRQLRRKIKRFRELNTTDAFLPLRTGPARGSTNLHPRVEQLIQDEIRKVLKVSPDAGVDDIHPVLVDAASTLGLRPPGRATVSRRLRQLRKQTRHLPDAIGRELRYKSKPVRGPIEVEAPLSVVEMDHTICDAHIIDSRYRQPIGRPVLTLLIDRTTRVILGMLLTLEAPSRLSAGLCLHHGVFSKSKWLSDLGIPDACWPGFGLVGALMTDNAKEFHAQSLQRACQVYGIETRFRPPGCPAAGGIIERAIGTFMVKVRLLPGASYSKLIGKAPRGADRAARMTLKELELYIARQVSIYHKTTHRTLGMPPASAWERAWTINGQPTLPSVPDSAEHFLLTFLPGESRTVTREGVRLHSLQYQSDALAPLIEPGTQRMVRFDPRDLSRVFVETANEHVPVSLSRHVAPPFSLWEWREIHRRERELGQARDPGRIADELRANRALIEESAKRGRRVIAARRVARGRLASGAHEFRPSRPGTARRTRCH